MSQDPPLTPGSPEDSSLQQAIKAIQANQYPVAREILAKLLKNNPRNPDYWVWLSVTSETEKERLYCLQTACQIDPKHPGARRGLQLMGALPAEDKVSLAPLRPGTHWKDQLQQKPIRRRGLTLQTDPSVKFILLFGIFILLGTGILAGVSLINKAKLSSTPAPLNTPRATVTPYPTISRPTPTQSGQTAPLSELLGATYTPTLIYAATPHGDIARDSYVGAMQAYQGNKWQDLQLLMAQVATAQPGSADALFFIGESFRFRNNYTDALPYYEAAIAVNPNFAPAYLGRARANSAKKNTATVLADLNLAVQTDPRFAEAYTERGLYYINKSDIRAAQADFEQAQQISDSALVELNLAKIHLANKENAAALQAATLSNQMDITLLESYLLLGMAYHANGQDANAIAPLQTYLQQLPTDPRAYTVLGSAYYSQQDYANARKYLEKSISLDKNQAESYYWLGNIYLALNENDKALQNFQAARTISPDSFDYIEGVANGYLALGECNNSYALIIKVENLATTPDLRARFLFIRAKSLEMLGESTAAYRDWNEILGIPQEYVNDNILQSAENRVNAIKTTGTPFRPTTRPAGTFVPFKRTATPTP